MKTIFPLAVLFRLCWFNAAFGGGAETVYVDSGLMSYCLPSNVNSAVVAVHVQSIGSTEAPKRYLLGSTCQTYVDQYAPHMSRFPLSWSVRGRTLHLITPSVVSSAMNCIVFQPLTVQDIALWDNGSPTHFHETLRVTHHGDVTTYHCPPRRPRLRPWVSGAFAVNVFHDVRNKLIWYSFCDTNFIARLPLAYEGADAWRPCENPARLRWMEFQYAGWDSYNDDLEILHSEDFQPDGFDPVGSVRIVGKRVLSDDPKAKFPEDADWLIWERDGDTRRLCQMRGGRWSVCKGAPRTDAPKVIVVNNDSDTVLLLYSTGMDAGDVEGSMRRIIAGLTLSGECM